MNNNNCYYIAQVLSIVLLLNSPLSNLLIPASGIPVVISSIENTGILIKQEFHSDNTQHPDYTNSILNSMKNEFMTATKYCKEMESLGENQYTVTALAWYFKTFRSQGDMDVKYQNQWIKKFPNIPYPGKTGIFIFKEEETTPEQLGNILYAMVGRKLGFSPELIYQGSGFAAGSRGSDLKDKSKYYGDSKEDYESITRGMDYVTNRTSIVLDITKIPPALLDLLSKFS